jgi:poly(hydroxyalkanoate) depolymerase family esterase
MALSTSMAEALRLTRTGNLMEATRLLQSALSFGVAETAVSPQPAEGVIQLVPERLSLAEPKSSDESASSKAGSTIQEPSRAGCFEERTHRDAKGTMTYWLYRPAQAPVNAALVVMLHGCTQSAPDFAHGTGMNHLADELGFVVAYPQQSPGANPQKCWNWFRPSDQCRDRGEPAQLAGITREIIAENQIDPDRVYVAGLSAGGATAAILAQQYPDIYAAVGIHSGLACGIARDLPSALAAMSVGGETRAALRAAKPSFQ